MAGYSESNPLGEVSRTTSELVKKCNEHFDAVLFEPDEVDSREVDGLQVEYIALSIPSDDNEPSDDDESVVYLVKNHLDNPSQPNFPYWAEEVIIGQSMDMEDEEDSEALQAYVMKYPIDNDGNVYMIQEHDGRRLMIDAPRPLAQRIWKFIFQGERWDLA